MVRSKHQKSGLATSCTKWGQDSKWTQLPVHQEGCVSGSKILSNIFDQSAWFCSPDRIGSVLWSCDLVSEGFTCYRRIKSPPAYTHPGPSPFPNPPHSRTQKSHRGWHTPSPPAGRTWPHRKWRTPPRWWRWWRAAGPQGRSRGTWPRLPPRWRPPNVPRGKDLALAGNSRIHSGGQWIFRKKR